MSSLEFISQNWQFLSVLFVGTGGSGWLGWLLASKSRKIDFHRKVFKMNEEMLDSVKIDFADRIQHLQSHIKDLIKINSELKSIVVTQQKEINDLKKINNTTR